MSVKKRGLGRGLGELGLNELLGDMNAAASTSAPLPLEAETSLEGVGLLRNIPVDVINPGRYQPRKSMSEEGLEELANSIRAQGIIQPIVLRKIGSHSYEIIAGERRWRAAQKAGLSEVPAIVRDIPDEAAIAMSLIENIQRRDLNVIEEAFALQRLITEFQMTHQGVADAIGKSRSVITNTLRLLKLNPDVRELVEQGYLEMGHARALLALEGTKQSELANTVVTRALSVRETENLIRHVQEGSSGNKPNKQEQNPDVLRLQTNLSEKLGAKVAIACNTKGKGKLIIHYNSLDELDGILDHIQ